MGYRLNRLDEPVFMAVSKPLLTEFGIHYRLESCVPVIQGEFIDIYGNTLRFLVCTIFERDLPAEVHSPSRGGHQVPEKGNQRDSR